MVLVYEHNEQSSHNGQPKPPGLNVLTIKSSTLALGARCRNEASMLKRKSSQQTY